MVCYAQAIGATGLFASGLATGLTLSYPLVVNKHFLNKAYSIPDRLAIWQSSYELGHQIPVIALIAAASFVGQSVLSPNVGLSLRHALIAAGLQLSIAPFTLAIIAPINKVLMSMRSAANDSKDPTPYTENDVEPLFKKWQDLHNVRVVLSAAGFVVALGGYLRIFKL